jgi:hypothetical protein
MDPWLISKHLTWYRLLRHCRKALDRHSVRPEPPPCDLLGQAASDRIRALIEGSAPFMMSRLGGVEMRTARNYLSIHEPGRLDQRVRRYLRGEGAPWWWDARTARQMIGQAGFFPVDPKHLERFALLFLENCRQVDLLGSWSRDESRMPLSLRPCRVPLGDLDPFSHGEPWSEALAGRKVLVVHPFAQTIRSQYQRREALFKDPRMLPAFELQTFQAVQSLGGQCPGFKDWFAALDWMQQGIAALDFEVAIIGAGAYGMALAAFIKRELGRKALHLGGTVQIMFGIRGRRWDQWPKFSEGFYNEAWVRPSPAETPEGAGRVEGGCYW